MLTDTDIRARLSCDSVWQDKNRLFISPLSEECLTPVGYDLRVGSQYASSIDADVYTLEKGQQFQVRPGDTVLITTLEDVGMPQDRTLSALITSKVSKVSLGLSHISTNIDPDWKGKLLIALHNPSHSVVSLSHGEPFCTINFFRNVSPSTKECGKEPGRSDILIKQFVTNSKANKLIMQRQQRRVTILNYTVMCASISLFGGVGFYLWGPTEGFAGMVAIGIAIPASLRLGRK